MELVDAGEPCLVAQCRKINGEEEKKTSSWVNQKMPFWDLQNDWEEPGWGQILERIGAGRGGELDQEIYCSGPCRFLFVLFIIIIIFYFKLM